MAKGAYKNQPKGLNGISNNINKSSSPVDLDDYVLYGNRSQRRFAAKEIKKLEKARGKLNAG